MAPIKVFVSSAFNGTQPSFDDWITNWNSKHGESSGKLELVSDLNQADVLMVVANGSDTLVTTLPANINVDGNVVRSIWSQATLYLARRDSKGLKVLWTSVVPVLVSDNTAVLSTSRGSLTSEMEKRMKARSGKK